MSAVIANHSPVQRAAAAAGMVAAPLAVGACNPIWCATWPVTQPPAPSCTARASRVLSQRRAAQRAGGEHGRR